MSLFEVQDTYYAEVIVPLNLQGTFTYIIPKEFLETVEIGKRVVVQFGAKKFYAGLVVDLHDNTPDHTNIKSILSVLDERPILQQKHLSFWEWLAEYYMCSMGEIYKAALPSGLKLESETKVFLNSEFSSNIDTPDEQLVIDLLVQKKALKIQEIANLLNKKSILPFIKKMVDKEILFLNETIRHKYKPKTETHISLKKNWQNDIEKTTTKLSRAPKQKKVFSYLIEYFTSNTKEKSIEKSKLVTLTESSGAIVSKMVENDILDSKTIQIDRLDFSDSETTKNKQLNEHQLKAFDEIKERFQSKDITLLHGVTSSGKTEIYIHLISEILEQGKQVLYLLPEIALTTQIITRIKQHFGSKIGIYHSRFSDNERVEVWKNLVNHENPNSYQVVLGVRSSLFLPFSNLGLIIVDEEHENSFKQYDPAPRYNARDASIVLAKMHSAKLLLGTATPSMETYANAKAGRYGLVELKKRHKEIALPQISIVDIKAARKKRLMHSHFSKLLIDKIEERLEKNEQVILFQNRRGFSPFLECNTCGTVPKCKFCDVSLTYHKHNNSLVCHYCGYHEHNDGKCKACGGNESETRGFGTEKIEDEVKLMFPDAKTHRMDLDTTRAKDAYETIIGKFERGMIDILIGTQMVTKGLDFEKVSLVGILNADTMLNMPDFRAFERSFQMITQVSGRAGRSKKRGEVVIQTTSPDHVVLRDVLENDFFHHQQSQMRERHEFSYPPFTRLIKITIKHRKKEMLDYGADMFANELRKIFGHRILGPEYPMISRIQNLYIKTILIKVERKKPIQKAKAYILNTMDKIQQMENLKGIIFIPDVDPY